MALANANEEVLYAQVATEMISPDDLRPGLWAKALATADGDERRAKAVYIKLRVEQLQLQLGAAGELARVADEAPLAPAFVCVSPSPPPAPRSSPIFASKSAPSIQCAKCGGKNVKLPAVFSKGAGGGPAPYCIDCQTFIYGREWSFVE